MSMLPADGAVLLLQSRELSEPSSIHKLCRELISGCTHFLLAVGATAQPYHTSAQLQEHCCNHRRQRRLCDCSLSATDSSIDAQCTAMQQRRKTKEAKAL